MGGADTTCHARYPAHALGVPPTPQEDKVTMAPRTSPPFRADHVGSLLRPQRLLQAREDFAAGRVSAADLRPGGDTGRECATDGDFARAACHMDFIYALGGVSKAPGNLAVKFHNAAGDIEYTPASIR